MSDQQPQRMNHESPNDTSNPPSDSQSGGPIHEPGVEALEEFNLVELFSEVFKKHSADEVEEYFTVGTAWHWVCGF